LTFNSFEDETLLSFYAKLPLYILSIPLRMKPSYRIRVTYPLIHFQFLWGWNRVSDVEYDVEVTETLSIPLRMKLNDNDINSSLIYTFNSFEDETYISTTCPMSKRTESFNSFEDETQIRLRGSRMRKTFFQFLWGWNQFQGYGGLSFAWTSFQFLWGWNMSMKC